MQAMVRSLSPFALLGLLLAALAACGGGGGGGSSGVATYTVGGAVTGLRGTGLVLQDNGGDDLVVSAPGSFTFATKLAAGATYYVRVSKQPAGALETCVVTNGSGTVGNDNVTAVSVTCTSIIITGGCGVSQTTGTTSAGPAEGTWSGLFPILFGVDGIGGSGIVTADGQAFFRVGGDELWAGTVLASSGGAVSSTLTRYQRASGGSAGGLRNSGTAGAEHLAFGMATAHTMLSGKYQSGLSNCQPLSLGYNDLYQRAASLPVLAGVYTLSDGSGYTLTVTMHSDGQLDGSDTNGCVLLGSVTVPDPAKNHYSAVADASSCGTLSGHYTGLIYLADGGTPNDNAGLQLFLANPDAAIFDTLYR